MKFLFLLVCAVGLSTAIAYSEASITITVTPQPGAAAIPSDFVGLSFGMRALLPGANGNRFFSPTNQPLVTLFQNIGISHLRVGGTTVESPPATPIPDHADIDSLFAFVKAARVQKVIYSFRLLETNSSLHYDATNAALAKYIWDNHRDRLDCFALGNEPDLQRVFKQDFEIRNFATYLAKWQQFAAAITNAVPLAKFAGPDAASANGKWPNNFADREKNIEPISVVTVHFYAGGAGRGVSPSQGIEDMLSKKWIANNEALYKKMAVPVLGLGLPYRFTEANDHYTGGVTNASDTFAGALWALDFLHWWAAHGASGVNFHNTQWVVNDVITLDPDHQPAITPKGYGFKVFELGSQGVPEPVTIQNPAGINLTAYAVRGSTAQFITIINKEHGSVAPDVNVTIAPAGIAKHASVIYLSAPNSDVTTKTGVTLGGVAIDSKEPWRGAWKSASPDKSGQCIVKVPAASAAIVKISTQ